MKPDILIVHTKSWVDKNIREIESVKYVIGGHPGITQFYRGAHSSFWAIYNNDYKLAIKCIKKIRWIKIHYFILYYLLLFNIPSKLILKILNR